MTARRFAGRSECGDGGVHRFLRSRGQFHPPESNFLSCGGASGGWRSTMSHCRTQPRTTTSLVPPADATKADEPEVVRISEIRCPKRLGGLPKHYYRKAEWRHNRASWPAGESAVPMLCEPAPRLNAAPRRPAHLARLTRTPVRTLPQAYRLQRCASKPCHTAREPVHGPAGSSHSRRPSVGPWGVVLPPVASGWWKRRRNRITG